MLLGGPVTLAKDKHAHADTGKVSPAQNKGVPLIATSSFFLFLDGAYLCEIFIPSEPVSGESYM